VAVRRECGEEEDGDTISLGELPLGENAECGEEEGDTISLGELPLGENAESGEEEGGDTISLGEWPFRVDTERGQEEGDILSLGEWPFGDNTSLAELLFEEYIGCNEGESTSLGEWSHVEDKKDIYGGDNTSNVTMQKRPSFGQRLFSRLRQLFVCGAKLHRNESVG